MAFEDNLWWEELGLRLDPMQALGHRVYPDPVDHPLRNYKPVGFISRSAYTDTAEVLSLTQVTELVKQRVIERKQELEEADNLERERQQAELKLEFEAKLKLIHADPKANELITEGDWAGLSWLEAHACTIAFFSIDPGPTGMNTRMAYSQARTEYERHTTLPMSFGIPQSGIIFRII